MKKGGEIKMNAVLREYIRKSRKQICDEIYELQKDYEEKTLDERKEIDIRLLELGNELMKHTSPIKKTRIESLLEKGDEITGSEIMELMEMRVSKKHIAEKTGIPLYQINIFLENMNKGNKIAKGS